MHQLIIMPFVHDQICKIDPIADLRCIRNRKLIPLKLLKLKTDIPVNYQGSSPVFRIGRGKSEDSANARINVTITFQRFFDTR